MELIIRGPGILGERRQRCPFGLRQGHIVVCLTILRGLQPIQRFPQQVLQEGLGKFKQALQMREPMEQEVSLEEEQREYGIPLDPHLGLEAQVPVSRAVLEVVGNVERLPPLDREKSMEEQEVPVEDLVEAEVVLETQEVRVQEVTRPASLGRVER